MFICFTTVSNHSAVGEDLISIEVDYHNTDHTQYCAEYDNERQLRSREFEVGCFLCAVVYSEVENLLQLKACN